MRVYMPSFMAIPGLILACAGLWFFAGFSVWAAGGGEDKPLNALNDEEKAAGWRLLFDGNTTTGWRQFRGKSMPDKWQVVDGALTFLPKAGEKGGDIVTLDQFDNFELALEWKIALGGNSGVMYRVSETGAAPWFTGPEYQILDNAKHSDGRSPLTSAASCYGVYAPSKDMTRPVGEWNQTRIVANGNHIEHWLNGEKVVEYEIGSPDWQNRIKASKFKDMPRFAKESKGHIDLQDHGDQVAYRNIKIRPLGEKKAR